MKLTLAIVVLLLSLSSFARGRFMTDYKAQFLISQANNTPNWQKSFCQFRSKLRNISATTYGKLIPLLTNEVKSAGVDVDRCIMVALSRITEPALTQNTSLKKFYTDKFMIKMLKQLLLKDQLKVEVADIVCHLGEDAKVFQNEIINYVAKEDFYSHYFVRPLFLIQTPEGLDVLYKKLPSDNAPLRQKIALILGETKIQQIKTVQELTKALKFYQKKKHKIALHNGLKSLGKLKQIALPSYNTIKDLFYVSLKKEVNEQDTARMALLSLYAIDPKSRETKRALRMALEKGDAKLIEASKNISKKL